MYRELDQGDTKIHLHCTEEPGNHCTSHFLTSQAPVLEEPLGCQFVVLMASQWSEVHSGSWSGPQYCSVLAAAHCWWLQAYYWAMGRTGPLTASEAVPQSRLALIHAMSPPSTSTSIILSMPFREDAFNQWGQSRGAGGPRLPCALIPSAGNLRLG